MIFNKYKLWLENVIQKVWLNCNWIYFEINIYKVGMLERNSEFHCLLKICSVRLRSPTWGQTLFNGRTQEFFQGGVQHRKPKKQYDFTDSGGQALTAPPPPTENTSDFFISIIHILCGQQINVPSEYLKVRWWEFAQIRVIPPFLRLSTYSRFKTLSWLYTKVLNSVLLLCIDHLKPLF